MRISDWRSDVCSSDLWVQYLPGYRENSMQVLSRQRGVSLIRMREPGNAGGCPSECGPMRRRERGFTLVELVINMAVAMVLIMRAVPSFTNITPTNISDERHVGHEWVSTGRSSL